MFRGQLFAWPYGMIGFVLGALIVVSSLEQLGGPFEAIGILSAPVSAAWLGWLLMCGISLARTRADGVGPKFFFLSALAMVAIMGGLVVPALVGLVEGFMTSRRGFLRVAGNFGRHFGGGWRGADAVRSDARRRRSRRGRGRRPTCAIRACGRCPTPCWRPIRTTCSRGSSICASPARSLSSATARGCCRRPIHIRGRSRSDAARSSNLLRMAAAEQGFRAEIAAFPQGDWPELAVGDQPVCRVAFVPDPSVARDPLFAQMSEAADKSRRL